MVTRLPAGAQPRNAAPHMPPVPAIVQSGALSRLEDSAKDLILRQMKPFALKAGQYVFREGDAASNYLMVKSGSIKVLVATEQGREIVLYRVEPGQTCVLTTSCLLSGSEYEAEAVAESDSEAIILPKSAFEELMATSARFRQFVFSSYGERLHTLIGLVQEIMLKHVDRRLARHLLHLARDGAVSATHQALAQDLNTAREVVTRLLSDFSEKGWVELSRARVMLKDEQALRELALDL
jgi:CRP/FNR family transcriptional regulator